MKDFDELEHISEPLLQWYQQNARVLPWRESKNPYHIWVSEIMLQQTRVEAVKPYYEKFLQTLPTVRHLAEAEEETLLKLWEGLGYYSRVRNMQKAAQQVMEEYGGEIPADYTALLGLKGIGSYTAGAIASIAFSLPHPAVDGNVLRVMSRLTADEGDIAAAATKKGWEERILEILPIDNPGRWNQAIMELGATVCLPNGAPKCAVCPLRKYCKAYERNQTTVFPVKAKKKPRTIEHLTVFFMAYQNKIALVKRPSTGLLANLWELPNLSQDKEISAAFSEWGIKKGEILPMKEQKHIFTHVEWRMECYFVNVMEKTESPLLWVNKDAAEAEYALPSAFKKIWQEGIERLKEI
ncbi:MAG: A/G-specific adenine glycosylase [Anaerotignum sp.]|nr:A/G-specific adenine glycosylase [Anaerotignum sp.]